MIKKKSNKTRKCKKPLSHQRKLMLNKSKSAINNHSGEPSAFFNYAHELYKLGDTTTALNIYKQGLKRNPNNNAALINIALILIGLYEFTQAILYLTRAIVHTPDQYFAYIYRSVAYVGDGKKAEAYLDFKTVYEKYPDKIHHFSTLDKTRFPQIDFDQAMLYCLYPDAVVHLRPDVYFPTVDCPVDEICLLKEFCLQKEVCPQNDMDLLREIIIRQKLGHPLGFSVETVIMDMDEEIARREVILLGIESKLTTPRLLAPVKCFMSIFRKLFPDIQILNHKLTAFLSKIFLMLILPYIGFLQDCEVIFDI